MAPRTRTTYEELETVAISEDVPELGVEVSRPDGTTIGFTQFEADEEGAWRVVTYTSFD